MLPRDPRILFIRTDRLGETLLNLPVIAALKQALPHSRITMLAHAELAGLLGAVPDIAQVLTYTPSARHPWWLRAICLARELRPHRFQMAVVSNPKKELHLAIWLAGIPVRIGYNRKWPWTLTRRFDDCKALGEVHEVEYNKRLLHLLGVRAETLPPVRLAVAAEDERYVSQLLAAQAVTATGHVVAVHPWTSNPAKQWPARQFRRLIERLARLPGVTVALIGGVEEQPRAAQWFHGEAAGTINLTGRLSLTQLAALFRRVRVLISNDSGPAHLAALVGTPTVVLFGTAHPASGPQRWGPWGTGHTVIWKPTMAAIEVDEVFRAAQHYVPVMKE